VTTTDTTTAPAVLTCSVCKLGTNTTRDGKCIECIARCSCEEAMALRAELAKLRELARELFEWVPGFTVNREASSKIDVLEARARALGVEVRR
jgi:hypothetical protein